MKVSELISMLEQYDGEMDVILLQQSHWPLEYKIDNVFARSDLNMEPDEDQAKEPDIVYISEGAQIGYGPRWK